MASNVKKILITSIILFIFSITLGSSDIKNEELYFKQEIYRQTTSELVIAVSSYINSYGADSQLSAKLIITLSDMYDINLKLILAQAHLESHFGTKGIAKQTNSIFNVGTFDNGTVLYTYDDPNNSIEPYLILLRNNYLIDKNEDDLLNDFVDINGNRYASNKRYENQLRKIVKKIEKETPIDSLTTIRNFLK